MLTHSKGFVTASLLHIQALRGGVGTPVASKGKGIFDACDATVSPASPYHVFTDTVP